VSWGNRCAWPRVTSSAAAFLLLALVALLVPSARSQTRLASLDQERATSRYGVLKVKEYGDFDKRLVFNGRAVLSLDDFHGANYLSIQAQTRVGLHDIYVIAGSCCIACDTEYVILDISGAHRLQHTRAFGTCWADPIISHAGDELRIDMPDALRIYRYHQPRYYTLRRWRYAGGRLRGPSKAGRVSPAAFGEKIDWASFNREKADLLAHRREVRPAQPPPIIATADLAYAKVLVRNRRDGWVVRPFYDPFDHILPGQWRSVQHGGRLVGVVGVSRDGRAALVASNWWGCGTDCSSGPHFNLILRRTQPSLPDCTKDWAFEAQVDGASIDLDLDGGHPDRGATLERAEGLTVAPTRVSFTSLSSDDDWTCYRWELGCLERSPLLQMKSGKRNLRIQNTSCAGDQRPYDFDLKSAPFFALPEWLPG
jgi:hypothetical protein